MNGSNRGQRGFKLLELMVVLAVTGVLTAIALPYLVQTVQEFRASGDARSLAGELSVTKFTAAGNATRAELTVLTTSSPASYEIEVLNRGAGTYGLLANSGAQFLSQGNTFSYGSIQTPAGSQSPISEPTSIIFNSRGIPINSTGTPTANSFYIANPNGNYYAVTVSVAGTVAACKYQSGSTTCLCNSVTGPWCGI